ncbi:MAG: hypothetical protein V4484_00620 [Pseudomonadota bacterium]
MKSIIVGLAVCAISITSAAAQPFKDFAGMKCSKAELVTIVKVDNVAFAAGPMKGYYNVTVNLTSGESSTAPMPPKLAKKLKAGDKACQATFVDQD